jgi:hypothetical protein
LRPGQNSKRRFYNSPTLRGWPPRLALAAGLLLALIALYRGTRAQTLVQESAAEQYGTHYVILIDDSYDFSPKGARQTYVEGTKQALANLLFHGRDSSTANGGREVSGFMPFRPGKDRISVAYFAVHEAPNECYHGQPMSERPDDIFSYAPFKSVADEGEFVRALGDGLSLPCRFTGNYSPIATAPNLILPFLQERMTDAPLFSRTYIVQVTNNTLNGDIASPVLELRRHAEKGVKNTDVAARKAEEASRLFKLVQDSPRPVGTLRLFLNISRVEPLLDPQAAISYASNISLDRLATSTGRLRLAPATAGGDSLTIYLRRPGEEYVYSPRFLEIGFQDEDGRPWRVGDREVAGPFRYDLTDCRAPACAKTDETVTLSLFAVAGDNLTFSTDELRLSRGHLTFTVGFNYQTPLYDRAYVQTEKVIRLEPSEKRVPSFWLLLPEYELTNGHLAGEWGRGDTAGLTAEEAKNRILRRRPYWYGLLALTLISLALLAYRRYSNRLFDPELEWEPAGQVVVDFDNPARSRILVGALKVLNRGEFRLPWLGRWWRNKGQPTAKARLTMEHNSLQAMGLVVGDETPLGFISAPGADEAEAAQGDLRRTLVKPVSHEDLIFVFLAGEVIKDCKRPYAPDGDDDEGVPFPLELTFAMEWSTPAGGEANGHEEARGRLRRWWVNQQQGREPQTGNATLLLKPERSRKAVVKFEPAPPPVSGDGGNGRLHFDGENGRVSVGRFVFSSQARRTFAEEFEGRGYAIEARRGNVGLGTQAIFPARTGVVVRPGEDIDIPVYIKCDGELVPNPAPPSESYSFRLIGDFDGERSSPGPHDLTLFRDPARAEIELNIVAVNGGKAEVFWEGKAPRLRSPHGGELKDLSLKDGVVVVSERHVPFHRSSAMKRPLLALEIGNSCQFGEGLVSVRVVPRLELHDEAKASLKLTDARLRPDNLLEVFAPGGLRPLAERDLTVEIREGEPAQVRELRFNPAAIARIDGAEIKPQQVRATVTLDIKVRDDEAVRDGNRPPVERRLVVAVPLHLEMLPDKRWLCIDFGTSAIAAAVGTAGTVGVGDGQQARSIHLVPLQEVKKEGEGKNGILAQFDFDNLEAGNSKLLPSLIACDADIRYNEPGKSAAPTRPGYPFSPADYDSLKPGHPNFIALPATSRHFRETPRRIVYSLKSWLGRSAERIVFPAGAGIEYLDDDGTRDRADSLPLERVVESGFAALAEAYLFDKDNRAEQLVVTHPNSFTDIHKQRLHRVANKALSRRLSIQLPERRIRLVSESDAVAYDHCYKKAKTFPPEGRERILVYDFGAGTIDLSVIEVTWEKRGTASRLKRDGGWVIKSRLGVAVAGNHIDELLARLIDGCLKERKLVETYDLSYRHPIVTSRENRESKLSEVEYRHKIIEFWRELRRGKHKWDGEGSLVVKVGETGKNWLLVSASPARLPEEPKADEVSLFKRDGYIYLAIPAVRVNKYPLLVNFLKFVTKDVIDEALKSAGVRASDINTVLVSGRGALWPGVREAIWDRFPRETYQPRYGTDDMKEIVAHGAIAWQNLGIEPVDEAQRRVKIGALINDGSQLVLIGDGFTELDLESPDFRIVQVELSDPQPLKDKGTLREHFYNDLGHEVDAKELGWEPGRKLEVKLERADDGLSIKFRGESNEGDLPVISGRAVDIPWPAGYDFLLRPLKDEPEEIGDEDPLEPLFV